LRSNADLKEAITMVAQARILENERAMTETAL
jgi:hypothetical protein